uniref:Uncharacterized protein n=1 Tax=Nothoprocta perdicaria TaxID=30464 RepID=A0A8C6YRI3_NOTPE
MAISPDSTVSSLLASCSIDSDNSYSGSVIHYKDKLYSSASEALEAYIEDFDLKNSSTFPGKNYPRWLTKDQLELLVLKAEKSLETSTDDLSNALKNDDSPSTIDILEAERSWENIPVAL